MINPPAIVLSLLPAPQQAILSMDLDKSYAALYGNAEDAAATMSTQASEEKIISDDSESEEESDDFYSDDYDEETDS